MSETAPLNANLMTTLRPIHAATADATKGYLHCNPAHPLVKALLKDGLIATDDELPKDGNKLAYFTTALGAKHFPDMPVGVNAGPPQGFDVTRSAQAPAFTAPAPGTATEGGDNVTEGEPKKKRAGGPRGPRAPRDEPTVHATGFRMAMPEAGTSTRKPRDEKYPFSTLQAPDASGNDSFFVAATPAVPDPVKSFNATVYSANKRFAKGPEPRVFKIVRMAMDPEHGCPGARIFRIK